jgi:hypothetical protein
MMTAPPSSEQLPTLSTNFTGWNAAATVAYARKFVAKLTGHPNFPEPWPSWVASLGQLTEKGNALEAASLEAESRDTFKVAQRNALNKDLQKDLRSSILHVEMVAQGNLELITSLGLNQRHAPIKRRTPLPMLAPQLTVTQSKKSGFLDGKVVMCPGARMFLVQITDGDPSVEANWVRVDIFSKQLFEVGGREPGKTYYLRARCYGPSGTGPWSAIVTIISL